jgi:cell division septal protein FtsQ
VASTDRTERKDRREAPFLRRPHTPGVRRKRRPPVVRVAVSVALAAAAALLLTRFAGGGRFALSRFEISGNSRTRTEEILSALAAWRGRNLVALDLAPVARRLAEQPWVERATVTKRFPDGVAVRVVERTPVALFREGDNFWWVDRTGRVIARYDPRRDSAEYVILSGDRRALPDAVALLEDLRARRPEYFAALSEIASLPDGGFGMMDAIFRKTIRVLRADAPEKIHALLDARGFIESRGWEARAIDLRFADRIILVGAYGAGNRL